MKNRSGGTKTTRRRQRILKRDNYTCIRCGVSIRRIPHSIHHRKQRQHGGNNWPSNLITVCGLDSGQEGYCHYEIELYEKVSRRDGFLVWSQQYTEDVPIKTYFGWRIYLDNGTYHDITTNPPIKIDSNAYLNVIEDSYFKKNRVQ